MALFSKQDLTLSESLWLSLLFSQSQSRELLLTEIVFNYRNDSFLHEFFFGMIHVRGRVRTNGASKRLRRVDEVWRIPEKEGYSSPSFSFSFQNKTTCWADLEACWFLVNNQIWIYYTRLLIWKTEEWIIFGLNHVDFLHPRTGFLPIHLYSW